MKRDKITKVKRVLAAKLRYNDEDSDRFEARLKKNARTEPRVPAMIATKGVRTRFTGLTSAAAFAALRTAGKKKAKRISKGEQK
jgi:hypothetical protein